MRFFQSKKSLLCKFAISSMQRFSIERCLCPEILLRFFLYSCVTKGIRLQSAVLPFQLICCCISQDFLTVSCKIFNFSHRILPTVLLVQLVTKGGNFTPSKIYLSSLWSFELGDTRTKHNQLPAIIWNFMMMEKAASSRWLYYNNK